MVSACLLRVWVRLAEVDLVISVLGIMDNVSFHEVCKHAMNFVLTAEPNAEAKEVS